MQKLQEILGYVFRDAALLKLALSHPSLGKAASNQRLEFLGDAVLGLVVAEMLYQIYGKEQEGELARRHAGLVRGETLTAIAQEISLGDSLMLSSSEAGSGGRLAASNLEDALEALIGAIYLDGGLEAAKSFIIPRWRERAINLTTPPKDAKTSLQEWAQARGLPVPVYKLIEQTGPAHAPTFTIEVMVRNYPSRKASASSKRTAEQLAAEALLADLENHTKK